jgi:hypothetical protein
LRKILFIAFLEALIDLDLGANLYFAFPEDFDTFLLIAFTACLIAEFASLYV